MRRLLLLAAVVGAALALAPQASAVYQAFRTPSGNIGCIYSKFSGEPAYLRCDILSKLKPLPPRPASCPDYVEWGYGYWMGKTGSSKVVCAGDTALDSGAKVLKYGWYWSRNGYRCESERSGLTCTNASGRGWFLSRQSSYRF